MVEEGKEKAWELRNWKNFEQRGVLEQRGVESESEESAIRIQSSAWDK